MYLVETIKQSEKGFDVTRETYESEKEARARFWYLAFLHREEVERYSIIYDSNIPTNEDNTNVIMYQDENLLIGSINFEIL